MAPASFFLILIITTAHLVLSVVSLPTHSPTRHTTCLDPPLAKLRTLYANAGGQDSALGRTKRSIPERPTPEDRRVCPPNPNAYSWYLEERSTCPWYFEVERQESRYPQSVQQARCKCDKCLDDGAGARGKSSCQPVILPRPALIRTDSCVDGEWVFAVTQMSLSVGCTCALPMTSQPDAARRCPAGMPSEMC